MVNGRVPGAGTDRVRARSTRLPLCLLPPVDPCVWATVVCVGQRQQAARVARLNAVVRAAREDAFGRIPALSAVVRRTRFRTR